FRADPEVIPASCDEEEEQRGSRDGLREERKERERLERSVSHETAAAARMLSEGRSNLVARDADGRPSRAMTLDPSLYRREQGFFPGRHGGPVPSPTTHRPPFGAAMRQLPSGAPRHPNFPFGKELAGHFSVPGMTPDLSGGPPMPPSGPPFLPGVGGNPGEDKFWEHARSHIKEDKLLQCPKCAFVTEYKHHLEYHLRNHFGSKPFKCNKCNYTCVNKSMLNSHMKSHTNVYQYRCSDCTYATKYCHSLKLHLKKYDHKPATVLNQDGSLPQGVDADASGLSIITKRGPPRGPRGSRKEKGGGDPYMRQLFGMPPMPMSVPGMNPVLNGMMPFWPMLPHSGIPGHPSPQPGMLPGMGNLARHMGMRPEAPGMDAGSGNELNESNTSEDSSYQLREDADAHVCRLCEHVAESSEALCLHFLQAHKDETGAGEVARMYNISEAALTESLHSNHRGVATTTDSLSGRRMSEPAGETGGSDHEVTETERRNTIAGLLFRDGGEKQTAGGSRLQDMCYPGGECQREEDRPGATDGMDILQQMTLKFGSGTMPDTRGGEDQRQAGVSVTQGQGRRRPGSQHKESPLDLTKPKSVSPALSSNPNSPRRSFENEEEEGEEAIEEEEEEQRRLRCVRDARDGGLSKVTQLLLRKRPAPEDEDVTPVTSSVPPTAPEVPHIVTRKRSRKGKAYKLDTLCRKLQERHTRSPHDTDDSDTDAPFERFQPLHATTGGTHGEGDVGGSTHRQGGSSTEETEVEEGEGLEEGEVPSGTQPSSRTEELKVDPEVTPHKDDESEQTCPPQTDVGPRGLSTASEPVIKVEVVDEGNDTDFKDKSNDTDFKDKSNDNKMAAFDFPGDEDEEDPEVEFEKLKRSLDILNNGLPDEPADADSRSSLVEGKKEREEMTVSNKPVSEAGSDKTEDYVDELEEMEGKGLSDRDSLTGVTPPVGCQDRHRGGEEEEEEEGEEDTKEMINTVLENRKKPLPPAVRRGTDLAWKLLHDPRVR
ncbi:uncharacterized protein LOC106013979, partial [Aplysia californica]|uniref:Uncharacterized protein LOC106013979 n=1 Tax=Aplysia californica TaxID=6500 RepID=A0ABM1AEZ4_APLCA